MATRQRSELDTRHGEAPEEQRRVLRRAFLAPPHRRRITFAISYNRNPRAIISREAQDVSICPLLVYDG